jgi:uncharacterized protein (DUF2147 family)
MRVATVLMSAAMGADLIVGGTAWAASDPRGVWIDDKGRGGVEIKDCGAKLCGHIVWARDEADSNKGCGKQIMGDVTPQDSGLWDNGWIYDPDSDKKYNVELKPLDDNRLRVKGYAGMKFFSRSMIWTRPRPTLSGAMPWGPRPPIWSGPASKPMGTPRRAQTLMLRRGERPLWRGRPRLRLGRLNRRDPMRRLLRPRRTRQRSHRSKSPTTTGASRKLARC